jgi:predicted nucleotidyltransferase
MLAAGKYAEDKMSQAIVEGLMVRPKTIPTTDRQRELWTELKNSFADQDFVIYGPAAADAAREGIKALEKEVEKMLTVPSVKLAYDHFMTVWQLTKEQTKE